MVRVPKAKQRSTALTNDEATVGYEARLWQMADALRGSMDAAEYKHVVLGLIFLKYISDAFEAQQAQLEAEKAQGADPEDPDEYRALNIFWVPLEARWTRLKAQARRPTIGQVVDDAMAGIERDNAALKGVLPRDYARPGLDKIRLGQLIDQIEVDLVDCMVALPGQLFYSTQIPACLWFLARNKQNSKFRDRRGHVLFIDARKLGRMVDRTHRELTDEDIARIANTYHAWHGEPLRTLPLETPGSSPAPEATLERGAPRYCDIPGFCKSVTLKELGYGG
jgi:type I restriction-modification system DNA methylase subunit